MKVIFILIAAFLAVQIFVAREYPSMATSSPASARVILYATSWCGYCAKTRKLLDKNEIPYFEYDIEKSDVGKKQYDNLNGRGIPLLKIGKNIIRGYDPDLILEFIN